MGSFRIPDSRRIGAAVLAAAVLLALCAAPRAEPERDPRHHIQVKAGVFHYDADSRLSRLFERSSMDEWETAQEIEYEFAISRMWGVSAAFAYNGDTPAINLYAMTFPFGLLMDRTENLPFSQLWYPNYTQGQYWVSLRHYAVTAMGTFQPMSLRLVSGDGPRLELAAGAGGGPFWLSKKIRSRTGTRGSLAGEDVWTVRPGAVGMGRVRIAGGNFAFGLEYKFQYVPPVRNVNPLGYDYNVTGSTAYLFYGFEFL